MKFVFVPAGILTVKISWMLVALRHYLPRPAEKWSWLLELRLSLSVRLKFVNSRLARVDIDRESLDRI